MLPPFPLLYSCSKAAKILGVSTRTLARLIETKQIGCLYLSTSPGRNTPRIPRQAIVDFARVREPATTNAPDF
jgi:transposase